MPFDHVFDRNGRPAIADDMPPAVRAFAFLLEHATRQRDAQLPPCACRECRRLRRCLRAVPTGRPGEMAITYEPVAP